MVERTVELVVAGELHSVCFRLLAHAVPALRHPLDLLVGDGLHHPVAGGRHDDEVVDLDVFVLLQLGLERLHDAVVELRHVHHVVIEDAEDIDEALYAPVLRELLSLLRRPEMLDEGVQPKFERIDTLKADPDERLVEAIQILWTELGRDKSPGVSIDQ